MGRTQGKRLFKVQLYQLRLIYILTETKSGMDSDSDSIPDDSLVLCRTCTYYTDLDSDPYSLFLYRTGIRVRVRVRLRKCKCAITHGNDGDKHSKYDQPCVADA